VRASTNANCLTLTIYLVAPHAQSAAHLIVARLLWRRMWLKLSPLEPPVVCLQFDERRGLKFCRPFLNKQHYNNQKLWNTILTSFACNARPCCFRKAIMLSFLALSSGHASRTKMSIVTCARLQMSAQVACRFPDATQEEERCMECVECQPRCKSPAPAKNSPS